MVKRVMVNKVINKVMNNRDVVNGAMVNRVVNILMDNRPIGLDKLRND